MALTVYCLVMTGIMAGLTTLWDNKGLINITIKILLALMTLWSLANVMIQMGFIIGS